jgi:heterodisulfide reductase subunit C2
LRAKGKDGFMEQSRGGPVSQSGKKDKRLDLTQAELGFAREVTEAGGGSVSRCYGCGACSAHCPILPKANGYDPRRLIRLILLGQREEVLSQPLIWYCSTCYNCHEVCPQEVSFTEIGMTLKNLAVREGRYPAGLPAQVGLLSDHGRLYEIGEFENEKRAKLDLPPLGEEPDDYRALLSGLAEALDSAGEMRDEEGGGA